MPWHARSRPTARREGPPAIRTCACRRRRATMYRSSRR
jgi:hypothetical protein